jgi:cytochrome c oxidase accessory protein FixG
MSSADHQDLYEKHIKIQNRWVNGFYQNIRSVTIWITLFGFFLTPWFTWHHRQAVLFEITTRKFYFFNLTFWPQDFILLLLLLLSAALTLMVITTLAGRLYCGYTCPQTVWTKCFMWMEYMIEGDRSKRIKRDQNPWELSTVVRRSFKHVCWLFLALYTAMTFVGYFFPIREVILFNVGGFGIFWIAFFTLATYLNAGWMREQVCLYMCPYARFQSVMFDPDTMVITYDHHRGEPRGSLKVAKNGRLNGDCIDCQLCVQVCPTGIDIRNGLQMACIGCAACVDACNSVMDKINFPRGLIRYDTENGLDRKKTRIIRPRLIASFMLLTAIFSVFLYLLLTRVPLQFNAVHDHEHLARLTGSGAVENSYVLTLNNLSQEKEELTITVEGLPQAKFIGTQEVTLLPGENRVLAVTLTVSDKKSLTQFNSPIKFIAKSKDNAEISAVSVSNFFNSQ